MKAIAAVLLIFVAFGYAEDNECRGEFLKTVFKRCLAEHGGDKVHVFDILNLKKARDEEAKCFRSCIMAQCNYFNAELKINNNVPRRVANLLSEGDEDKFRAIEDAGVKCLRQMKYEQNLCSDTETFARCYIKQCSNCGLNLRSLFDGWSDDAYLNE